MDSTSIGLRLGDTRATVDTIGVRMLSLRVGDADLTQPVTASTPHEYYNGVVLAPWPNRVRGGRWRLGDDVHQLDITEPARGGALHGLLSFADYRVLERSDDAVTLGARIPVQHGWPFELDTTVRYQLEPDGVLVTHTARNRSASPAPWAVGAHPYLRVGAHPVEGLELRIPTETVFDVDARLDPTGESPVDGTAFDLRGGRRVGELRLDTAFRIHASTTGSGGLMESARLAGPDADTVLLQDADWAFVQVFTTDTYRSDTGQGDTGPIGAIAVEPMSAPPDALNSGIGLAWIEPGASWTGSWALRRETR